MQRREFITVLSGTAVGWPLAARAQQGERMRRIGVLMPFAENDPDAVAQLSGFMQGLAQLGWTDGRNVRMDLRWAVGSIDRTRMFAKELVNLQPDVIFAHSTPATAALQRETRTSAFAGGGAADRSSACRCRHTPPLRHRGSGSVSAKPHHLRSGLLRHRLLVYDDRADLAPNQVTGPKFGVHFTPSPSLLSPLLRHNHRHLGGGANQLVRGGHCAGAGSIFSSMLVY
jgi:hypothetical protein